MSVKENVAELAPNIVYIMGMGRSGTTILDVLLSNSAGVCGVGEVTHIFRRGFIDNDVCACGETTNACHLWANVIAENGWSESEMSALALLTKRVDWHTAFPLLLVGINSKKELTRYREANRRLYNAVSSISGDGIIVDSSKYPGRALALSRAFGERVKVVCITRSPKGLIASYRKPNELEQKPKSFVSLIAYYVYVLLCMRLVKHLLGSQAKVIRYEQLASDPEGVLRTIEKWSGYDFSASRDRVRDNKPLDIGHIVTGNRLRKRGKVIFKKKVEDVELVGFRAKLTQALLNFWQRTLMFR